MMKFKLFYKNPKLFVFSKEFKKKKINKAHISKFNVGFATKSTIKGKQIF